MALHPEYGDCYGNPFYKKSRPGGLLFLSVFPLVNQVFALKEIQQYK